MECDTEHSQHPRGQDFKTLYNIRGLEAFEVEKENNRKKVGTKRLQNISWTIEDDPSEAEIIDREGERENTV